MKLRAKLYLGFLSLSLVIGISSTIILFNDLKAEDSLNGLVHINLQEITSSSEVAFQIQRIKSNIREILLETKDSHADEEVDHAIKAVEVGLVVLSEIGKSWVASVKADILETDLNDSSYHDEVDELQELVLMLDKISEFSAMTRVFLKQVELGHTQWPKYADYFEDELEPFSRILQILVLDAREDTLTEALTEGLILGQLLSKNTVVAITAAITSLMLAFALGVIFSHLILTPLNKLIFAAGILEDGDLKYRVAIPGNDEVSILGKTFNKMAAQIEERMMDSENLAMTDQLTGLNNRRAFFQLGKSVEDMVFRYDYSYSVMMIDIDLFKAINDTHGHAVGDEVIHALALTIKEMTRPSDISARLGGEEFAIILPETNCKNASVIAERLRINVSKMNIPNLTKPLSITVSIGVAELDNKSSTLDKILADADKALYDAKEQGRNRVKEHVKHLDDYVEAGAQQPFPV